MNRKSMIILVRNELKKLSLFELEQTQRLINAGQMTEVFEDALEQAIESKKADEFQDTILKSS